MRRGGWMAIGSLLASAGCSSSTAELAATDSGVADSGSRPSDAMNEVAKDCKEAYPPGPYALDLFSTIPDASYPGLSVDGSPRTLAMHDYYEPCVAKSRLLVIRVSASWCGNCRWDLAHTKELVERTSLGGRIELVDLLVASDDNVPAVVADLPAFRARIDAPVPVAIDPLFGLQKARLGRASLPLYLVVDTRTMSVRNAFDVPEPEWLVSELELALSELDRMPSGPTRLDEKTDGLTRRQWDLLRDMKLPAAPPPDPTNGKADDLAAAKLGESLFADTALSPSNTISCATCHARDKGFADGLPQSKGIALGDRNAPSLALSSHSRWQFWDGRADSQWAQATAPLEDAKEFASTRLYVAHAIYDRHRTDYQSVFGVLPDLTDKVRFPASGKPGDPAWEAMSADDRTAVTRVLANVGKAIAAFERTLRVAPNALDRYIGGDKAALTDTEKSGLAVFFNSGCVQCHYGPRLTDDAFHNVRFPTGRVDGTPDQGRKSGIALLLASEFRSNGPFSDSPITRAPVAGDWTVGAFKTPALRGLPITAPYGHGGTIDTIEDVLKNYSTAGLPLSDGRALGASETWLPQFSSSHISELAPFLRVLAGDPL